MLRKYGQKKRVIQPVPVKTLNGDFYAIIKGSPDGKFLISSFIKDNKYPKIGDLLITSGISNSLIS